jgi:hypothetical protein
LGATGPVFFNVDGPRRALLEDGKVMTLRHPRGVGKTVARVGNRVAGTKQQTIGAVHVALIIENPTDFQLLGLLPASGKPPFGTVEEWKAHAVKPPYNLYAVYLDSSLSSVRANAARVTQSRLVEPGVASKATRAENRAEDSGPEATGRVGEIVEVSNGRESIYIFGPYTESVNIKAKDGSFGAWLPAGQSCQHRGDPGMKFNVKKVRVSKSARGTAGIRSVVRPSGSVRRRR